jgi:chromosome partitioning protein
MLKIVVNTPKGGVGKTTTATNISLYLARHGRRVWALDFAGGLLMSNILRNSPEFGPGTSNLIETHEGQRIPQIFPGASNFDVAVLDTDDAFTVAEDLLLGSRVGWRVVAPVNPYDYLALDRVPREIRSVATAGFLAPDRLGIYIVTNIAHSGEPQHGYDELGNALQQQGIRSLLVNTIIPHGQSNSPPIFIDDSNYARSIGILLAEIGV